MSDPATPHLRPFFPSAADFAAATTPHFQFLVDDFGFAAPSAEGDDDLYEVAYHGPRTAVLLDWDVAGGFFACNLAPRAADGSLDPDYEQWLSVNEIVAARGAPERWIGQADLEDVDLPGYGALMERVADNLKTHCADVLRGDWSVRAAVRSWMEERASG